MPTIGDNTNNSTELLENGEEVDFAIGTVAANIHPISKHIKPTTTIEEAIQTRIARFFTKCRARGDAKPCGPHDADPIYIIVFGIEKGALGDEKGWVEKTKYTGLEMEMTTPLEIVGACLALPPIFLGPDPQ